MLRRAEIFGQEWLVLIWNLKVRLRWASWLKRLLQLLVQHLMLVLSYWTGQHWLHLWHLCWCLSSCCSFYHLLLFFSSACQRASWGNAERSLVPL